jgi:hypothetical protein
MKEGLAICSRALSLSPAGNHIIRIESEFFSCSQLVAKGAID